jgi:uncharacterized protein YeeX (DUF496 family)
MRAQEREEFMQKPRKVHPFEKRLLLLEEAQEQMKQKMDQTDGEDLEERVSDLESKLEDVDFKLDDVEFNLEEVSEKVEITRVSWRMRSPGLMISRVKSGSPKHRRARGLDEEHRTGALSERTKVD